MNRTKYKKIWNTPVGKDCIDLDKSLAKWLGLRLTHLGKYANTHPISYGDDFSKWLSDLTTHGKALLDYYKHNPETKKETLVQHESAVRAIRFVADYFGQLWD